MRRCKLATAAVLALPLMALATPAHADPGTGATVTRSDDGLTCFQYIVGEGSVTSDAIQVRTPDGVVILTCQFNDVGYSPDSTLRLTGWPCGTWYGLTFNSSFVVTPSGNATMVCRITPS